MATTRTKRTRQSQSTEDWKIEFLLHGCCKRPDGTGRITPYLWRSEFGGPFCNHWGPTWEELKGELLPRWLKEHPGTRPWAWWATDAPGPRQRIGGTGEATANACCMTFEHGLPTYWDKGTINPADPPLFESQAAFLQQHGLLTPAEERWLKQHPEALKPETIADAG